MTSSNIRPNEVKWMFQNAQVVGKRIMETRVAAGSVAEIQPDAVAVNLYEGVARLDGAAAVDKVLDGGAIIAALSLAGSVDSTPRLPLAISGPRLSTREAEDIVRGGARFRLRTLVDLAPRRRPVGRLYES